MRAAPPRTWCRSWGAVACVAASAAAIEAARARTCLRATAAASAISLKRSCNVILDARATRAALPVDTIRTGRARAAAPCTRPLP